MVFKEIGDSCKGFDSYLVSSWIQNPWRGSSIIHFREDDWLVLVWWVSMFCQGVPTFWTFLNSYHILAKGSLKIPSHTGHRHLSHSDLKSLKTNFLGIVGRRTTLEERNEPVLSHLWSNSPTGLQILLLIEWGRDAPWI